MIKKYIKLLQIFLFPIYWLSGFIKRDDKIWVFGSYHNLFNDNSKYLFIYSNEVKKKYNIKPIWITGSIDVNKYLNNIGFESYMRWSIKGIYFSIVAEKYFYSSYSSDINVWTSRNATMINLWHGIPLKVIEFDIKKGKLKDKYNSDSWFIKNIYKIVSFSIYRKHDYILSTSNIVSQIFSKSFRVPIKNCLEFGYPRTDIFYLDSKNIKYHIEKFEKINLLKTILSFNKVFIYMPTWRSFNKNFMHDAISNIESLNSILSSKNNLLLLKLHPNSNYEIFSKDYSNIIQIENSIDIYPYLPFTDVLITDYSSIFFDYILLKKKIILYQFDRDEYMKYDREWYFELDEILETTLAYTFDELLCQINLDDISDLYLKKDFFDEYNGNASDKIVNYFKEKKND